MCTCLPHGFTLRQYHRAKVRANNMSLWTIVCVLCKPVFVDDSRECLSDAGCCCLCFCLPDPPRWRDVSYDYPRFRNISPFCFRIKGVMGRKRREFALSVRMSSTLGLPWTVLSLSVLIFLYNKGDVSFYTWSDSISLYLSPLTHYAV